MSALRTTSQEKRYSAGDAATRRLEEFHVSRRDDSPDFIEAIARGLDVIRAFGPGRPVMSLANVANASHLPRPTPRRILLTPKQPGYVRQAGGPAGSASAAGGPSGSGHSGGGYELTPRVLD